MKSFLITVLLLISVVGFAQADKISYKLNERLSANSNVYHRIRIEYREKVDCYALNQSFKANHVPVAARPKIVITKLQEQAQLSQENTIALTQNQLSNSTQNVQPFWIVNIVVMEATINAIYQLAQLSEIERIDEEYNSLIPHDTIIPGDLNTIPTLVGAPEKGLIAINAPAMWALGYTGRGQLVYDYDTGVWPSHPSFSDRFMANFYPMEQSWTGYFNDEPNGSISSHGTHTLGTMAGLNDNTDDTIGVAFKSYWIANDYVTSTVQALPPVTAMVEAFEWALNPDGDVNTSYDIPDVINNSWRWRDAEDAVECSGYIVDLMNAIEAAGIANVFSGGNSGPTNATVNSPQRIKTSVVNTFTVGSIDANAAYPYPISGFSTRGPTQCAVIDSLEIHPEVVAPGQNVRSAWGTNEYNTISGTSMAAQHVSGAVLLLKEAFPYLSGEDLLRALYYTAIDFGDAGEDNVFGRGLIDVYAAYQYLAVSNTPVDPKSINVDLAIRSIKHPIEDELVCTNSFDPIIVIENLGDSTITSADINYFFKDQTVKTYNWTGTLSKGDSAIINLPSIETTSFGAQELTFSLNTNADDLEYDFYNNRRIVRFERSGKFDLPFMENFENELTNRYWYVENPDGSNTWKIDSTKGLPYSEKSVKMKFYSYNDGTDEKDGLLTSQLVIPNGDSVFLKFDYAYQMVHPTVVDKLGIYVSTDCGATYSQVFYEGENLNTFETLRADFVPELAEQWKTKYVDLTQFQGNDIIIKFEGENNKGNNLYLDNIWVYQGEEPENVQEVVDMKPISIFPNPANNTLFIDLNENELIQTSVQLFDVLGNEVLKTQVSKKVSELNIANLATGVYVVKVQSDKLNRNFKIIKQ